ncbi:MAG: hypothetical protein R3F65_14025 [bacterium]
MNEAGEVEQHLVVQRVSELVDEHDAAAGEREHQRDLKRTLGAAAEEGEVHRRGRVIVGEDEAFVTGASGHLIDVAEARAEVVSQEGDDAIDETWLGGGGPPCSAEEVWLRGGERTGERGAAEPARAAFRIEVRGRWAYANQVTVRCVRSP